MEAEVKQVIKEKEYVHDENHDKYASKGLAGTALGFHRWCRFGSSRTMGPPWWHWRWYA